MKDANQLFDYLWSNHSEAFEFAMMSWYSQDRFSGATILEYIETLGASQLKLYCETYLGEGGAELAVYRKALQLFVLRMATM